MHYHKNLGQKRKKNVLASFRCKFNKPSFTLVALLVKDIKIKKK